MINSTRGERPELNESNEMARRHDCESDIMRKLFESRVKINCNADIME